jgi:hypothetical protein
MNILNNTYNTILLKPGNKPLINIAVFLKSYNFSRPEIKKIADTKIFIK